MRDDDQIPRETVPGREATGRPLVADEVIATYVADAARNVSGIVELHGNPWQELSEKVRSEHPAKGVLVHWSDPATVTVDVHVKVAWGATIPHLAQRVQESVTRKVESLLDIAVERVTLYVDEIETPETAEERG
jgi:uncharacterized alkaline shock family protein YloU